MKEDKMSNSAAVAAERNNTAFKFKFRVSNFAFSRKLFGFNNDAYWQSKFQSKSHQNNIQFVHNIHKHNIKFKDLMKLTLNLEQKCNPSSLLQNTHFDLNPESNHKKIFFNDYQMATLDKSIHINFDSSGNQIMIEQSVDFEYWVTNIKLARLLNENESFLELSCVKTDDGKFIAFGFLYLCQYLKDKDGQIISALWKYFIPIILSNNVIHIGFTYDLSTRYHHGLKIYHQTMNSLANTNNVDVVNQNSPHPLDLCYPFFTYLTDNHEKHMNQDKQNLNWLSVSNHKMKRCMIGMIQWSNACLMQATSDKLYDDKYQQAKTEWLSSKEYTQKANELSEYELKLKMYSEIGEGIQDKAYLLELNNKITWLKNDLGIIRCVFEEKFLQDHQYLLRQYSTKPNYYSDELVVARNRCSI